MRSTDSRQAASWTAREHDVVVFPIVNHIQLIAFSRLGMEDIPTPPFPPATSSQPAYNKRQ